MLAIYHDRTDEKEMRELREKYGPNERDVFDRWRICIKLLGRTLELYFYKS